MHIINDFTITDVSTLKYRKLEQNRSINLTPSPVIFTTEPIQYQMGSNTGTVRKYQISDEYVNVLVSYFQSDDKLCSAVKFKIVNKANTKLFLDKLVTSLIPDGRLPDLNGPKIEDWLVTRLARQKNDIPGSFCISKNDANAADAKFMSMNTEAGGGITFNSQSSDQTSDIFSEPAVYISDANNEQIPGLLIGVLGQKKYLSDIVIHPEKDRKSLKTFDIRFLFDDCLFPACTSKETDWLIFRKSKRCWDAFDWFYDTFARQFEIPVPPKPAPSLYCSWYYYGPTFREQDLDENLELLKHHHLPFDVFLIDLGWFDDMGLWEPSKDWPSGMAAVAHKIRDAGYEPGIWTCPFVVMADSPIIKEHPELVARDYNGEPVRFGFRDAPAYAIDTTCPYAEQYLTELFQRLKSWGYNYHKLDFLRSVEQDDSIRFYDRTCTRAQAYVRGMSIIRKAAGQDGYIIACGGLFEASSGLVDSVRSGSDVKGEWYDNPQKTSSYLHRIKQNVYRNFYNKLWHTDPDAMMLRLADKPWENCKKGYEHLSLGFLTDEEAFTTVVNQFIGDGLVCFSERLKTTQKERLEMLRHVMPVLESKTQPLDIANPGCPSMFVSRIKPRCDTMGNSVILTIANWNDTETEKVLELPDIDAFGIDSKIAVFEFYQQQFYGIMTDSDIIKIRIPAHGTRVFRLTEITDDQPKIIGTDLHITAGCQEITSFKAENGTITAKLESPWDCQVNITALFDPENRFIVKRKVASNDSFTIQFPEAAYTNPAVY
jgi:hypothetical protein